MVQGESCVKQGTIICTGGFILPDKNAAANRVVSNGKLFARLGMRTVFLGAAPSGERFNGIRPVNGCKDMFEQAHPASSREWLRHLFSTENLKELVSRFDDVRMIILYNLPLITLLRVRKAFKGSGIRIVSDCTEWTKDTDGSAPKKIFKAIDEFFIRKFLGKYSDGLIVISSLMEKSYCKNPHLLRLPPLIDAEDGIWHQTPKRDSRFEFCFAGIPDGKKESLGAVVQAFQNIGSANSLLRIVGISKEEFCRFYPEVASCADKENIIFEGRVSHSEAIRFILGCDCYIFIRPSDRRNNAGFPTKFAESFTCGVPVITTDVSDVSKYLANESKGTLLKSTQPDEIKKSMITRISAGKRNTANLNKTFHYANYIETAQNWLSKL